jgi:hypothetical protein
MGRWGSKDFASFEGGEQNKSSATLITPESELLFEGLGVRSNVLSIGALLAMSPATISFCHPDFYQIRSVAYSFDPPIIEVPGVINVDHGRRLLDMVIRLPRLQSIVVFGIVPNFLALATAIKATLPGLKVF